MSATQRVSEFPNENLTVSNSKLFCRACQEELALKKNVITNRVQSAKHQVGKSRLVSKEAKEKKPSTSEVDTLAAFPFLSGGLNALKTELHVFTYLAAVEDISLDYNPLEFWKRHKETLPSWTAALCKIILVQPSSAASERVFSILKQSFGEQQTTCLQDYIEASLMPQYNKH